MTVRQRAGWIRVGLRLGRREVLRSKARAALVVLLVMVPTAAMAGAVTVQGTSEWSEEDQRLANVGTADMLARPDNVTGRSSDAGVQRLLDALPVDADTVVVRSVPDRVQVGNVRSRPDVTDLPITAAMSDGRFIRPRGELEPGPGEAVLSEEVADDLGVQLGDVVRVLDVGAELTVVGTIVARNGTEAVYVAPDGVLADVPVTAVLVDLPAGADVSDLPVTPGWAYDRLDLSFSDQGRTRDMLWTYLAGAVGLMVVGTLAAAAFAVGARRKLRTVGLLSSVGAPPTAVTTSLVAEGAVLGSIGALLGIVVGVTAVVVSVELLPWDVVASTFNRPIEHASVQPLALLPIVVIGTMASSVAAWLPSRTAARVPTLQALAGRRPLAKVPRWFPVLGVAMVGLGLLLLGAAVEDGQRSGASSTLLAVAGAVITFVGALALSPWAVALLERVPSRAPAPLRLASRSLARSRVRSAAVVAAMVAVAVPLLAGATIVQNEVDQDRCASCGDIDLPYLRDDQVLLSTYSPGGERTAPGLVSEPPEDLSQAVEEVLDVGGVELPAVLEVIDGQQHVVSGALVSDEAEGWFGVYGEQNLTVATDDVLDYFDVGEQGRDALGRGEAVSFVEPGGSSPAVRLMAPSTVFDEVDFDRQPAVPIGATVESPRAASTLPYVLLSERTVADLGFRVGPSGRLLFTTEAPLSADQRAELDLVQEDLTWVPVLEPVATDAAEPYTELTIGDDDTELGPLVARVAAYGTAFLLTLLVVVIGLSLAGRDSRDEAAVLGALGASRRTTRRTATIRAALLVGVAAMVATPIALLSSTAVLAGGGTDVNTSVLGASGPSLWPDWPTLVFVVVGLPLLVAFGTTGWSLARQVVAGRRLPTVAFPGDA